LVYFWKLLLIYISIVFIAGIKSILFVEVDIMTRHDSPDRATVTINKITLWKGATLLLAVLLIVSIYTGGFGTGSGTGNAAVQQPSSDDYGEGVADKAAAPSAGQLAAAMEQLMDDDAVEGDADAPVTIVEFSDYECPFCERFYSQTLGQIREEYVDTGKVKIVFRDYPLPFHAQAQKAAEAAECAGEQGKYYEMHDLLFEKGVAGGVSSFKGFASEIGLDTSAFDSCLDSGEMAAEVLRDMQDGQAAGVQGTPGFIINGQLVSGAQPFSAFKQVIDAELAKV
jgi:protein-disulfide isomerase